jgi:hypothetical protein
MLEIKMTDGTQDTLFTADLAHIYSTFPLMQPRVLSINNVKVIVVANNETANGGLISLSINGTLITGFNIQNLITGIKVARLMNQTITAIMIPTSSLN